MLKFFYTPFPRPKKTKINILKVYSFGLLISVFVIIFKPFNIENDELWFYNLITLALGVLFSTAICFMEFIVPSFFRSSYKIWNLGKAILWYTWIILFVSAVMFLAKSFLAGFNDFTLYEYLNVIGRISALSLIVSFFALGIINYFNKKKIALLSGKAIYKITAPNNTSIDLNLDEVMYIMSDDNYVDIHVKKEAERDKLVFRSSLKNVENQIINPISPIKRCHRQYLININYFEIKNSRSRNTTVQLKDFNDEIPVSKKYERVIKKIL